jgi:dTDP-4-amino-4,6-dideoxygalactose transaminase
VKHAVEDLAIFGGRRASEETLHVGRPNIGNRQDLLRRINDILDRRWLSNNGDYVQEFERHIAGLIGVRHCIAVCNGTVALEMVIRATGLAGEVIVPSFTFIATAHALQWQAIAPVFCDVDPRTHTIDPGHVERMITPRTTGIIGVHLWGQACDVDALSDIAQHHHLKLLFDAAHALGSSHKGRMIGNGGDAEVFSFHATKCVNAFEGGAVATNDDELAAKIRLMKQFGFAGYDHVVCIGVNGKMSEVSAAMGLTSLESMDAFISVNYQNYKQYQRELAHVPGVVLLRYDEKERNNYQYVVLEIDETMSRIGRDQLMEVLWAENILARRYFHPGCHRMEPYRSYYPEAGRVLPETERLAQRVMVLPTGTAIGPEAVTAICDVIRFSVAHGEEITARMRPPAGRLPVE